MESSSSRDWVEGELFHQESLRLEIRNGTFETGYGTLDLGWWPESNDYECELMESDYLPLTFCLEYDSFSLLNAKTFLARNWGPQNWVQEGLLKFFNDWFQKTLMATATMAQIVCRTMHEVKCPKNSLCY